MRGNRTMIKIFICEQFAFFIQTQNNLFYNHCEECFKYYRSNVELKSTALSAVPTPKSSTRQHVDFCLPLDCPNLSCHLLVAFEIRRSETFSNINWTRLLDLRKTICTARLSASFQQQPIDIYCLQLILKSI